MSPLVLLYLFSFNISALFVQYKVRAVPAALTSTHISADTLYNKTIPEEIFLQVVEALSYFPELKEVDITFAYKDNIKGSVMQAQPRVLSLFVDEKESRKYLIRISRALVYRDGTVVPIEEVPHEALVGWIGHELGHIMDYLQRSTSNMMFFGAKYLLSKKHLMRAELTADGFAIDCGMGHLILANKNFILENEGFEDGYKDKIRNLYMSPLQILTMQEGIIGESED
jgi:hypothetical protein